MIEDTARPTDGCTVVLAPPGELDLFATGPLRELLAAAYRPRASVVLDLQDVVFIDSSALSVILSAERRLQDSGGQLRLVNPADDVSRVLRICGLSERLVHARPVLTLCTDAPASS